MTTNEVEIEISDKKNVIPPDTQSTSDFKTSSSSSNSLLIFCVAVALLASAVAIVIAAVSLSQNPGSPMVSENGVSSDSKVSDEIWTFAIGHDGTNIEYIDEVSGTLRGFHVDIVDAVCTQANKNCQLIWDIYERCWDSQAGQSPRAGIGLMGSWYDACTGWFNTYERALTVQFSVEFRQGLSGVFYVRPGNPTRFNPTTIGSTQKIGFIDGWATDEHCLARDPSISALMNSQVMHYGTREELQGAVERGEVAAAFANSNVYAGGELDTVGDPVTTCVLGGGSMMQRKDSTLNTWWNDAFRAIQDNGVYATVCDGAATDHGHQPGATGDLLCV